MSQWSEETAPRTPHGNTRLESLFFIIPLIVVLTSWELLVEAGFGFKGLPSVSAILLTLARSLYDPVFLQRALLSFISLMSGLLLALLLAVPLAIAAGLNRKVDSTLTPNIMLIGALPDIALLPLFIYWFGSGSAVAILMAGVASFFPIYFTTREGVEHISPEYLSVATLYRSSKLNTYRKVILPAVAPRVIAGTRIAFDFVWEIVLAIEIFAQISGLGSFINLAVESGSQTSAFAAIFFIGIIALLADRVMFRTLETKMKK